MRISVGSAEDASRAAALYNAAFDDRVITAAGIRYRVTSAVTEDKLGYWRAEEDDDFVGWCFAGRDTFAPADTMGFAGIVVHPAHRRQGVGSGLWDVASEHLADVGVRRIVAHSGADAESMNFARARAFTHEATDTTSAVDPRTVGAAPLPPAGTVISPLSEFDGDPEPVYEADRASAQDEPGPSDYSGMTYADWRRLIWAAPDCNHDLSVAVVVSDVVVGTSFLYADFETGRALNAGTGVIREFRGRGLALLMKRHSLARSAAAGITRVITQNDETNAPMLAINARLGYRPLSSGHSWVLER